MATERGFRPKHFRRPTPDEQPRVPPGQYLALGFPVLSAGTTPQLAHDRIRLEVTSSHGVARTWSWDELRRLPSERLTTDIHCVTRWSKLDTRWEGVSLDTLLVDLPAAPHVLAESHDGYTTDLLYDDLVGGRAWVVWSYDGQPLTPEHGGPLRLLVPHLYLWKSAKWLRRLALSHDDVPGFWERAGYHRRGDPWQQQRHA